MLNKGQIDAAIAFNLRQGFSDVTIRRIQTTVGTTPDGVIGPKTVKAISFWQEKLDLDPDGKVGPNTKEAFQIDFLTPKPFDFLIEPPDDNFVPIDNLIFQGADALQEKATQQKKSFRRKNPRTEDDVRGITLHQMGFSRGGDPKDYLAVTAHFIITPSGRLARLHLDTVFLYSSNALNKRTVAVEFAGNFRNDKGRWWKGGATRDYLTGEQVRAGRSLLKTLFQRQGIDEVYAHCQGGNPARKSNCCGPEIWRSVAEWALNELRFKDTRDQTFGEGIPIPSTWRSNHKGEMK